jgi:hypothetical protein
MFLPTDALGVRLVAEWIRKLVRLAVVLRRLLMSFRLVRLPARRVVVVVVAMFLRVTDSLVVRTGLDGNVVFLMRRRAM